ncbi:MAG: hypothetical protein JWO08_3325, partial [Verrucomicrobiaceae bacterium]|nr:hypothetical protein [Verrucomicrobiaceae bacterium]
GGGGGGGGGHSGGFGGMPHGEHIGGPDPLGINKLPSGSYTPGGLNDPNTKANKQNRFDRLTNEAHSADRLRDFRPPPAPFVPQGPGANTGGSMEDEFGDEMPALAYGGPVPPGHSAIVGDSPSGRPNKTEEIVTALPGGGFTVSPNPATLNRFHPSMQPLPRLAYGTEPTLDQRLLAEGWAQEARQKHDAALAADGVTDLGGHNMALSNRYGTGFATQQPDTNVPGVPHISDEKGQVRFQGNRFDGYVPDVVPAGSPWANGNGLMPSDPAPVRDNIRFQTGQMQQQAPRRRAADNLLDTRRIAQNLADGGVDPSRMMVPMDMLHPSMLPPPRPSPSSRAPGEDFQPVPGGLYQAPVQDYGLPMLPPGVADQMASTRRGRAALFGMQQQQQAGQQKFQQDIGKIAFEKGLDQQGRMDVEKVRETGRDKRAQPVTIKKPAAGEVTFQGKHMVKGDQGPNGAVTAIANSNFGYMEDGGKHVMMENKGSAEKPQWAPFVKPTAAAQSKPLVTSMKVTDASGNVTEKKYQHDQATDSWHPIKVVGEAAPAAPAPGTMDKLMSLFSKGKK